MRRVLMAGLVAVVGGAGAPVGTAGAAPKPAPIVQRQSGVGSGRGDYLLLGSRFDTGTYDSSGQLGRGTYDFQFQSSQSTSADTSGSWTAHGTARLVRSDGAVLSGTVTTSTPCHGGPSTFTVDLTRGSRDLLRARLTMIATVKGSYATPIGSVSLETLVFSGTSSATRRIGYWMLSTSGVVHAFGGAQALGNASSDWAFSHIEPTPSGAGYWLADTGGQVFAFGDARSYGSASGKQLAGDVVTSLSSTPSGRGYWLFTGRGRALPFGDAKFYGDMRNVALNGTVIGSVATPTGRGYYMVALDGGVFTFGDAKYRGSMGGTYLNQPVVGLVPTATNRGYWLVAADGGIFAFGAPFLGSMGGVPLARPVIGMVRYGNGYMMVAQDGGIFDFSNQPFFGSLGGAPFTEFTIGAASVG